MITIKHILDVENYIDEFDAVIFDLDDTLYSEKEYVKSGFKAVAKKFPSIPDLGYNLWCAFESNEPAIDVVFGKYGMISEKQKALEIYRNHFPDIFLYPGVKKMLNRIKKNKKVGIVTDGRPEGQRLKLKALGLMNISFIITDELGGIEFRKPNQLAFIRMQEMLETDFKKMVYVGDNIKKDFIAPDMLGMKSIYFYNLDGLYI